MATLLKMQKPMARSSSAWWPHGRTWQNTLAMPDSCPSRGRRRRGRRRPRAAPAPRTWPRAPCRGRAARVPPRSAGRALLTHRCRRADAPARSASSTSSRSGASSRMQVVEELVAEHLVDGPHAVGPLGVAGAGVVLDEGGMGEEEGGHSAGPLRVLAAMLAHGAERTSAVPSSGFRSCRCFTSPGISSRGGRKAIPSR